MKKIFLIATAILMTSMIPAGSARAQQTPAANPKPAPAAKAPAAPGAKSGSTPAAAAKSQAGGTLDTPLAKTSYAIGLNIGIGMNKNSVNVDPEIFLQGLKAGLSGGKSLMSEEEMKAELTELQARLREEAAAKAKAVGDANKKEGDDFLAENKLKEGVVTLPDGLQYKILTAGTGPKPTASDLVVCNYRGTLINGTEFDSSYKRGQPATFAVNQVIRGWAEAVQLMPVGSKWQIFIPSEMAYGARGAGPDIGPNATLIFEVELISIQNKPAEVRPAVPAVPGGKP